MPDKTLDINPIEMFTVGEDLSKMVGELSAILDVLYKNIDSYISVLKQFDLTSQEKEILNKFKSKISHICIIGPEYNSDIDKGLSIPYLLNKAGQIIEDITPFLDDTSVLSSFKTDIHNIRKITDNIVGNPTFKATEVQTLIFSKEEFKTKSEAVEWAENHDFSVHKVDETKDSYRIRQESPSKFKEKSFRTISLTKGVKAVIGTPKSEDSVSKMHLLDRIMGKVSDGMSLTSEEKTALSVAIDAAKGQADFGGKLDNIMSKVTNGEELNSKEERLLSIALDAARGMNKSSTYNSKNSKKELKKFNIGLLYKTCKVSKKEDIEKRTALGIVLEPEELDLQGDIYSAEEVEKAAWDWMINSQDVGLMHKQKVNDKVKVVESYIAPVDMEIEGETVKKGTWMLRTMYLDDELWNAVKKGEITAFSIGGTAAHKPELIEV